MVFLSPPWVPPKDDAIGWRELIPPTNNCLFYTLGAFAGWLVDALKSIAPERTNERTMRCGVPSTVQTTTQRVGMVATNFLLVVVLFLPMGQCSGSRIVAARHHQQFAAFMGTPLRRGGLVQHSSDDKLLPATPRVRTVRTVQCRDDWRMHHHHHPATIGVLFDEASTTTLSTTISAMTSPLFLWVAQDEATTTSLSSMDNWRQYVPLIVSVCVIVDILLGSPLANSALKIMGASSSSQDSQTDKDGTTRTNTNSRSSKERIDSNKVAQDALQRAQYTLELQNFLRENQTDADRYRAMEKDLKAQTRELDRSLRKIQTETTSAAAASSVVGTADVAKDDNAK